MQAIDARRATIDCWLRRERISLRAKVLSGPASDDIVYWGLALDIKAKNWQAQINLLTLRVFSISLGNVMHFLSDKSFLPYPVRLYGPMS